MGAATRPEHAATELAFALRRIQSIEAVKAHLLMQLRQLNDAERGLLSNDSQYYARVIPLLGKDIVQDAGTDRALGMGLLQEGARGIEAFHGRLNHFLMLTESLIHDVETSQLEIAKLLHPRLGASHASVLPIHVEGTPAARESIEEIFGVLQHSYAGIFTAAGSQDLRVCYPPQHAESIRQYADTMKLYHWWGKEVGPFLVTCAGLTAVTFVASIPGMNHGRIGFASLTLFVPQEGAHFITRWWKGASEKEIRTLVDLLLVYYRNLMGQIVQDVLRAMSQQSMTPKHIALDNYQHTL